MYGSRQCSKPSGHGAYSGVIGGVILVGIGTVLLLDRLNMLGGVSAWQLWPLILIFIGLVKLFPSKHSSSKIEGLIWIAVGTVIELNYFEVINLEWKVIWPALLIVLGIYISLSTWTRSRHRTKRSKKEASSSFVDGFVVFGSREDDVETNEFEGGDIFCVMGSFEIDLRRTQIKGQEAVVHVKLVMGGVDLRVPDEWNVIVRGIPIMGAFENKSRLAPEVDAATAKRLIVEGSVIMGGVDIHN